MSSIRLNKYLAQAGICSRRKADEHIGAGDVYVNGAPASLGMRVDPENDCVVFQGQVITPQPQRLVYYALYKPRGVISTARDEKGRTTVVDLVPPQPRVYPVGRLDKDSEGLIILTNDGTLAYELTHPKFEHPKEYEVLVQPQDESLTPKKVKELFEKGIVIEGKQFKADVVHFNAPDAEGLTLHITLHTGYKRQIRRMCEAIGLSVISLKRVRISKLRLESLGLTSGEYVTIQISDILG